MTTQFKKVIIEICVLKIINDRYMYGFKVMEELSSKLGVNENTIYPLLRRLTTQNLFTTYQKETALGSPRKYYLITEEGKKYLNTNLQEWYKFTDEINSILGGVKE